MCVIHIHQGIVLLENIYWHDIRIPILQNTVATQHEVLFVIPSSKRVTSSSRPVQGCHFKKARRKKQIQPSYYQQMNIFSDLVYCCSGGFRFRKRNRCNRLPYSWLISVHTQLFLQGLPV
jgi:hypothetical protein